LGSKLELELGSKLDLSLFIFSLKVFTLSKTDPFDKEFIRIAEEVFAPLLKHCRKI
jgi:hypothetical protein